MSEENRAATLNDLYARIDKNKYAIELKFDPVAATENVNTTPTYSIINKIGSKYYFTVDSKLVITDVETREPKVSYITFSDITWNSGKASITLSTKEQGTIEYKVGEDGVYAPGTTIENLSHGDTVYARINNNGEYTEEETKVIYDGIKPEDFTVTTSDLTYNSVKLTTTGTTDNQTGLASYTYVAENNGNIVQEIPNQTVKEYPITGLEEQTEYVVYMLAYDNAGNVRKSNEVTVTTAEYVPPQISNPITTARTGNNLDAAPYNYSWNEIESLAKAISDDNRNIITYTTTQVTITMDGKTYTLGVGDYKNVTYGGATKQVRILGFNHDTLATLADTEENSKNHYEGSNTYAGISFEFVDFIITSAKMNSNYSNVGGWASSPLRNNTLKTDTTLNNISIGSKIKEVSKTYNTGNKGTTNATCTDKLWLLACSEIWQNGYNNYSGYYGYCNTKEGEQYAYYKVNTSSTAYNNTSQTATRKESGSSKSPWWLRSPKYDHTQIFCCVTSNGCCYYEHSISSMGIAPGFSI